MKLPEGLVLYRGLGGTADLPDSFFQSDQHGCRGFAEWGFMSTTASKQIAINYSGINTQKPLPLVLAIRIGAADRGACIRDFSQYMSEVEYLFVPCSFVEPEAPEFLEITSAGVVRVFPVRVRANAKSATVDELERKKKTLHMASFKYLVAEIEHQLITLAQDHGAEERLARDPSRSESHSVAGFVQRIVQQCRAVYSRHESATALDFNNDHKFRSLVLEMVTVKDMAIAKLSEWLENQASSPIRFRFNAELRTVHRRYVAFLQRQLLKAGAQTVDISLKLLKTLGWVIDSVVEENELGENRLMAAAAEGKDSVLKLLVDASASVNSSRRKDGVTAIWLAAQFGHSRTVTTLADLNADVNLCAADGASPVYIASQGGNSECIRKLVERKADVGLADLKGTSPAHQAAMNGHDGCLRLLGELKADVGRPNGDNKTPLDLASQFGHAGCVEAIRDLLAARESSGVHAGGSADHAGATRSRKIIISTGDVSDVDGFMALAEYARTGADVLFVMNYPAYVGVAPEDVDAAYAANNPGKGYRYSATQVLKSPKLPDPLPDKYVQLLATYDAADSGGGKAITDNERVKRAMTDLAFAMAAGVWDEARPPGSSSRFFYYIGGVNSINPFSETAIKNELLVYSGLVERRGAPLKAQQGLAYDDRGREARVDWTEYSDILMDFNGSLAFWNEGWEAQLGADSVARCLRGVFVMGGVYAEREPVTMPSIPGVLNRFSSATMNQLYHPECAAGFFAFLAQRDIPTFVVANNAVHDLATTDPATKAKTYDGVDRFMQSNGLARSFLRRLAEAHYTSQYAPPRKPFDFYAAKALTAWLEAGGKEPRLTRHPRTLHYSNVFGVTYVSRSGLWEDTRAAYVAAIDATPRETDPPPVRSKKEYFTREIEALRGIEFMGRLPVYDVHFVMDPDTRGLDLADDGDDLPSLRAASGASPGSV